MENQKKNYPKVIGKALLKIVLGIIVFVFLVIGVSIIAIRIPSVQTRTAQKIASVLSETLKHQVTIGSVDIDFFSNVILKNVKVLDYNKQELFYIGQAEADISLFSFLKPDKINLIPPTLTFKPTRLNLASLTLTEPRASLIKYQGSDSMNVSTFITALQNLIKTDTAKQRAPFEFSIDRIKINNGFFTYDDRNKPHTDFGVDYAHMTIEKLNGTLSEIDFIGDSILVRTTGLKAHEKRSGVTLHQLDTRMTWAPKFWEFDDLDLRVGKSNLASYVRFDYSQFQNFSHFIDSVNITTRLDSSAVFSEDVAMFAPQLREYNENILISGEAKGTVSNFNTKNIDLHYGRHSHIVGSINANGLPNFKETFIELRLQPSVIDARDIKQHIPANSYEYARRLGTVDLKGQFIGFFNDFVANGSFKTDLGNVTSDINLKIADNKKSSSYTGFLKTDNFNLGRLIGQTDVIKTITMNGRIQGSGFTLETARAKVDATVAAININNYNYRNITLNGTLSRQAFAGDFKINDPNLVFNLTGSVDLRKESQLFDVAGNLQKANLKILGITEKDLFIETNAKLDFTGYQLDDFLGRTRLNNTKVTYEGKTLEIDSILIISEKQDGSRNIAIVSDVLNFKAAGNFDLSVLFRDVKMLLQEYRLNFKNDEAATTAYYRKKNTANMPEYEVQYELYLKHVNELLGLWVPELKVSDFSKIDGYFRNGNTSIFALHGHIDTLLYNRNFFYGNDFEVNTSKLPQSPDVLASAFFTSRQQKFGKDSDTENFYVEGVWNDRKIDFSTNIAEQKSTNRATITGALTFLEDNLQIVFNKSNINVLGRLWNFSPGNTVVIAGKRIDFLNFAISHKDQIITAKGAISPDPAEKLLVTVTNFELENLNALLTQKLFGTLNGRMLVQDVYDKAIFESSATVDSLYMDDLLIGDVAGKTDWDSRLARAVVDIGISRDNAKVLTINGFYNPNEPIQQLNLWAIADGAQLKLVEPLLKTLVSDISGTVTGRIKVLGRLNSPILKGSAMVTNGKFNFTYLNTIYTFSDRVYFSENDLSFRNVKLRDIYGNIATLNGGIFHDGFQNMVVDMKASYRNFMVLNTTRAENELYYGTAIATGNVSVFGATNNLKIDVNAKTEKGTRMAIPLDNQEKVTRQTYIRFVNRNITDSTAVRQPIVEQKVDLSGIRLNMDLNITPDAYAEIIFDSKTGDIVRGAGSGQIKLQIDTRGEFNMYGQYEIDKGAYNFSLYNVVQKEFIVKPGGTITWYGDPYGGVLNLTATHTQYSTLPLASGNFDAQGNPIGSDSRRYPVTVTMNLTGNLLLPEIKLGMEFNDVPPGREAEISSYLNTIQNDEQELNRQVFSLLVLKRLSPEGEFATAGAGGGLASNLSDILSNQLSSWISQVDSNLEVDIGVGSLDNQALEALQVRLSYTLMQGRLRVSRQGGVGSGPTDGETNNAQTSAIGDWTVEYYLRPDGKLRARLEYETSQTSYTDATLNTSPSSSVSVLHTARFNSFKELLTRSKPSKKELKAEQEQEKIIIDDDPRYDVL